MKKYLILFLVFLVVGCSQIQKNSITVCDNGTTPHIVIMLDGVPYDVVKKMHDQGHFKNFHSPSKLISVFPSNTDLAYSEMLTPGCPLGYEALYYDRDAGRLSNGDSVYLKGLNAPWEKTVDYRIGAIWDPVGYVCPKLIFNHDLSAMEKKVNENPCENLRLYSVGTATIATKEGEPGIIDCLSKIENLCCKIMNRYEGKCDITLLADHGHNLTQSKFFDATKVLKKSGWHVTNKLKKPKDIVVIQFGLLTSVAIYTDAPAEAATVLLNEDAVELAIYPQGDDKVIVRDRCRRAVMEKNGYNFIGNFLNDDQYPDAPARIWRAFHGLVKHPADLVVTLKDGYFSGKPSFACSVKVASTHGSLNRANSLTFVMSTIRELPDTIRIGELTEKFPEMKR